MSVKGIIGAGRMAATAAAAALAAGCLANTSSIYIRNGDASTEEVKGNKTRSIAPPSNPFDEEMLKAEIAAEAMMSKDRGLVDGFVSSQMDKLMDAARDKAADAVTDILKKEAGGLSTALRAKAESMMESKEGGVADRFRDRVAGKVLSNLADMLDAAAAAEVKADGK